MENKRLTLNGIDGFLSGKWSKPTGITFIDDETVQLIQSRVYESTVCPIKLKPNTIYTAICENIEGGNNTFHIAINGTPTGIVYKIVPRFLGRQYITFTTPNSFTSASANFHTDTILGVKHIIKRPMIVEGSFPIPYEPKKGSVMVEPVPVKNLFLNQNFNEFAFKNNDLSINGNKFINQSSMERDYIKQDYKSKGETISFTVWAKKETSDSINVRLYDLTNGKYLKTIVSPLTNEYQAYTVTSETTSNTVIRPYIWFRQGITNVLNMQLEVGYPTPYEPYKVQLNKHAKRNLPNLR